MYNKAGNKNISKPKLLYVEDDQITIDVVKRILKGKYDVDSTHTGIEAINMAKENDYDAFLIDIGLPGDMNGIQLTKKLKELKDNKNKPYIAITAYAMPGDKNRFISDGLTHYLSKPFEFQKIIGLIDSALLKTNEQNINKSLG
jgi:two-component system cell cycle response regulator DivK